MTGCCHESLPNPVVAGAGCAGGWRRVLYRRFLRDRDARVAVFTVAAVLTALVFGYGEVQQRDESTLTACEGCGKTAVAAKE